MPSPLVRMVPAFPVVTYCESSVFHTMLSRVLVVPEVRVVQVIASELVGMVPVSPTTAYCDPLHATSLSQLAVPEVCSVQVTPSALVRIVPPLPAATNREPFQTMP